ncbi:hypothetical protein AWRI1631_52120 [Saccharomyces cerevisiae AWRI1631]|uniref:Uncharacterized protein n=1 Tax=Saccharomyces cerevisiae (strain AWRI1631) TaxID=545124 RepID=B5VHS2_YEAS6|nr:hypothetical protein AWRI1631_52120 [Saccharomyces cerevisiae AWRI1631]
MVNGLSDVIRPITITAFGSITTTGKVESVIFKVPRTTREKTGGDQVQDRSRQNQENLQRGFRSTIVQQIPNKTTTYQTNHNGQWVSRGVRALCGNTCTGNEHNSFQTFSQDSNKRQKEHSISSTQEPNLEIVSLTVRNLHQRPRNLHSPLTLHLIHSQHRNTHHRDHYRRNHTKDTFPQVFRASENILLQRIVRTDETCTDGQTNDEPE